MPSHQDLPVQVLLVGAGGFGRVHATCLRSAEPECQLVGVCDPRSPDTLADLGIQGWRTLEEALKRTEPDLVAVVTPTWTHRDIAERVIAEGYRVLIEKPLAQDPHEASKLIETMTRYDGWVDVVSQRRFQEGAQRLQECVASGALGTLSSAAGSASGWRDPEYFSLPWRGQRDRGGGNFLNQGLHLLDLMVWLFGRPQRTASYTRAHRQEGADIDEICVGIIQFEEGALATVESSLVANPGEPFRLEVRGDRGTAVLTDRRLIITSVDSEVPEEIVVSCDPAQALTRQYLAVAAAIREGGRPTVGVAEASIALDLAWNLSLPTPDGITPSVSSP